MAVQKKIVGLPLITTIITDTTSNTVVETAAAVAPVLFFVEVTNPNSVPVYTKIFNTSGVGNSNSATTSQHIIMLYCPANTSCYTYIPKGLALSTGLQLYSSTSTGIGAAQANPTSDVKVVLGLNLA